MGTHVTDDFNRADGGLGANWTAVTSSDMPQIVSNIVQPLTSAIGAHALYTAASFTSDQYASCQIITLGGAASTRVGGVSLRGDSASNTLYDFGVYGPLGATALLRIRRWVNGSVTNLTATGANQTVASGDTLRATAIGTVLALYINGEQKLSFDDSANILRSGQPGIWIYNSAAPTSTAQVDTWQAGDMTTITGLGRRFQGFNYWPASPQ